MLSMYSYKKKAKNTLNVKKENKMGWNLITGAALGQAL